MVGLQFLSLVLMAGMAEANNGTQAGRFVVEHPTLRNLGFEWQIQGDINRNAKVAVEYRRVQSRSASMKLSDYAVFC